MNKCEVALLDSCLCLWSKKATHNIVRGFFWWFLLFLNSWLHTLILNRPDFFLVCSQSHLVILLLIHLSSANDITRSIVKICCSNGKCECLCTSCTECTCMSANQSVGLQQFLFFTNLVFLHILDPSVIINPENEYGNSL